LEEEGSSPGGHKASAEAEAKRLLEDGAQSG